MNLSDGNRLTIVASFLLLGILSFSLPDAGQLRYTKTHTISGGFNQEQTAVIAYADTLGKDSLLLVSTKEDLPLHYFKNITTNVCFDEECRLLNITVYWNITGRYLGFELSAGEFLSKRDHEPFTHDEYERLNDLLAEPSLSLGGVSFEELIEISAADSVDAVSGATTADVSKMVVKGAAYTTYTLWNIVYGPTRDQVARLTEEQLSADLLDLILKSPDISDRVWALRRIAPEAALTPQLTASLLELIAGDDFYLAYAAIEAIGTPHLRDDSLQLALFSIYKEAGHSIRNLIAEKWMAAPHLSADLIINSRKLLTELNGKQLGDILKLYAKHAVHDLETYKVVAEILKNENGFISRQAYNFLKASNFSDQEIEQLKQE